MHNHAPLHIPLISPNDSRLSHYYAQHSEADNAPSFPELQGRETNPYDPDRVPPDFNIAINHGKAWRVHKAPERDIDLGKTQEVCPCCGMVIEGEELPLNCSLDSLYHLGQGNVLYFSFLKYTMGLLFLLFMIGGLFNLMTNMDEGDCEVNENPQEVQFCEAGFVTSLNIANKRDNQNLLTVQVILNFVSVVVIILFFHYMRYKMRKIAIKTDDSTVTPSDYTVKLSGIPAGTSDEDIKAWVENFSTQEMPITCRKIVRAYQIKRYTELEAEKDQLLKNYKAEHDDVNRLIIEKDIEQKEKEINMELHNHNKETTGVAYVVLTHAIMADYLSNKFQKTPLGKIVSKINFFPNMFNSLNGGSIKMKRAPEPTDILWKNLGYSKHKKFINRMVTLISTILVLVAGYFGIFFVYYYQHDLNVKYKEDGKIIQVLSLVASCLIFIINTILSRVIYFLADYEKRGTETGFATAVAKKQSVALLFNTAFTSIIVQIVIAGGYKSVDDVRSGVDGLNVYGKGGLLNNMFMTLIINALYTPIWNLVDPWYFYKGYQQKAALNQGEEAVMTQTEANTLFEGSQFNISYKYSLLIKTILLTVFYASAMPIALLISLFGLIFVYWVDKYALLRRCVFPTTFNQRLSNAMIEYLEWAALSFAVGNTLFFFTLKNSEDQRAYNGTEQVFIYLTLILSFFNIVFPMDSLNRKFFPIEDEVTENKTYDEARIAFFSDYDIQNPITREAAAEEFLHFVKQRNENVGALRSWVQSLPHAPLFNIIKDGKLSFEMH